MRVTRVLVQILMVGGFFLLLTQSVDAATYYLSTTGSDTANGSEQAPFRTFAKATLVLQAGDTLLVENGTYTEPLNTSDPVVSKRVYFPSGVAGNPITIKARNQRQAIIRPPGGFNILDVGNVSKPVRHLVIDGFVFDGTNMGDSSLIGVGIYIAGKETDPTWVTNITFTNNEIRNIGKKLDPLIPTIDFNAEGTRNHPTYTTNYGFWSSAMMVKDGTDFRIANNYIHHNGITDFDHAIYQYSQNTVMEDNIIFNNSGTCIKGGWDPGDGSAQTSVIRNNLCYNNGMGQFRRGANDSSLGRKPRGVSSHFSVDYQYYNNIIFGRYSAGGIDIIYGPQRTKVYNNFVYNTGGPGIIIGGGTQLTPPVWDVVGTLVRNNIAYSTNPLYPAINIAARAKDTIVQNNIVGGNAIVNVDPVAINTTVGNTIALDPKFVAFPTTYLDSQKDIPDVTQADAVYQAAMGLKLQSSSPAINAGLAVSEVQTDFIGVARPIGPAYDIGPFEFGGTVTPPTNQKEVRIVNVPLSTTKNGLALDAVIDNGTVLEGESDPAFVFSSGWTIDNNAGYHGGQARWTRTTGATATYLANGNYVDVLTKFESSTGGFDLYIGGTKLGNFRTNSGATEFGALRVPTTAISTGSCLGDVDTNGQIDLLDYSRLARQFQSQGTGLSGDINQDQSVDEYDRRLLVARFLLSCE